MGDSEIQVALTAQIADLQSGMEDAAHVAEGALVRIENAINDLGVKTEESGNKIGETLRHLAEAFGLFEVGKWAVEGIKGALELGEQLTNLSIKTGINTSKLQVLDLAAQATGSSMDRLSRVVMQLSKAGSTTQGKDALGFFGLKPSDLNDAYGALEKIGGKINELGTSSGAVRAELSRLLGRGGLELEPALAFLDEANEKMKAWGITLSGQTIADLKGAQEQFNMLGFVWQQDKAILVAELAPALEAVVGVLTELLASAGGAANKSDDLHQKGVKLADSMLTVAGNIGDTLIPVLQTLWHVLEGVATAFRGISDAVSYVVTKADALQHAIEHPIDTLAKLLPAHQFADAVQKTIDEGTQKGSGALAKFHAMLDQMRTTVDNTKPPKPATGGGNIPAVPDRGAAAAARKAQKDKLEAFTEEIKLEEAEAKGDLSVKMSLEQQLYDFTVKLYGQKSIQARKANVELVNAQQALATQTQRLALEDITNGAKVSKAQTELDIDRMKRSADAQMTAAKSSLTLKQSTAQQALAVEEAINAQETEGLKAEESKRYDNEVQTLKQQLQVLQGNSAANKAEIAKLNTDIETMAIEHERKLEDITNEGAKKRVQMERDAAKQANDAWTQSMTQMEDQVKGLLDSILSNTSNASQAWTKFTQKMARDLLEAFIFGGSKGSIGGALFGQTGQGGGIWGMLLGGGSAGGATGTGGPLQQTFGQAFQSSTGVLSGVFSSAFQAARGALSSIFSAIFGAMGGGGGGGGIGVGDIASGVGTVAGFFGLEGGGVLPSAAGGMLTGNFAGGMPAVLHPREMVLPRHLSEGIQSMVAQGQVAGHTFAPQIHINTIDSADFADHLTEHAEAIHGILHSEARRLGMVQ